MLGSIQTAFDGTVASQIVEGNRSCDILMILEPQRRKTLSDLGSLPLRNAQGITALLQDIADIQMNLGRYPVHHINGQRLQTVTASVTGRSLVEFVDDMRHRIDTQIKLPPDSYIFIEGEADALSQGQRDLLIHSALACAGIIILLSLALRRTRALLLVMVNVPFALVGGVIAVALSGGMLTLGSAIDFVTVFGISVRNSLMLVTHYQHLIDHEGLVWSTSIALRGASERLVPILMTATVTGLGLLPLAMLAGEPGNEIEGPMALVILGGGADHIKHFKFACLANCGYTVLEQCQTVNPLSWKA